MKVVINSSLLRKALDVCSIGRDLGVEWHKNHLVFNVRNPSNNVAIIYKIKNLDRIELCKGRNRYIWDQGVTSDFIDCVSNARTEVDITIENTDTGGIVLRVDDGKKIIMNEIGGCYDRFKTLFEYDASKIPLNEMVKFEVEYGAFTRFLIKVSNFVDKRDKYLDFRLFDQRLIIKKDKYHFKYCYDFPLKEKTDIANVTLNVKDFQSFKMLRIKTKDIIDCYLREFTPCVLIRDCEDYYYFCVMACAN